MRDTTDEDANTDGLESPELCVGKPTTEKRSIWTLANGRQAQIVV